MKNSKTFITPLQKLWSFPDQVQIYASESARANNSTGALRAWTEGKSRTDCSLGYRASRGFFQTRTTSYLVKDLPERNLC